MKFIGVSSPCWTFKGVENEIKADHKEILAKRNKMKENLGPGKYDISNEFEVLKKKPLVSNFGISARFPKIIPAINQSALDNSAFPDRQNASSNKSIIKMSDSNNKIIKKKHCPSIGPKIFFSSAARTDFSKTNTLIPGPGSYDVSMNIANLSEKKISFGYKSDCQSFGEQNINPEIGPGTYNPKYLQFIRGMKMTKSQSSMKMTNIQNKTMSKNDHNNSDLKKKLPKKEINDSSKKVFKKSNQTFSKAKKDDNSKLLMNCSGPGPTSYNVNEYNPNSFGNWKAKAFTISAKFLNIEEKPIHFVSPCEYNINSSFFKKNHGYSFSKAENVNKYESRVRLESQESFESKIKIDQKTENMINNVKGGKIGKASRHFLQKSITPGPGSYDLVDPCVAAKNISFSIGNKTYSRINKYNTDKEIEKKPINVKLEAIFPQTKLGKFGVDEKEINKVRYKSEKCNGVNRQYLTHSAIGQGGFSFKKSEKIAFEAEQNSEIGPGFYHISETVPQIQPWIKLRSKI